MATKPKKFTCIAVKWFDKVNGNTYHSVRVINHESGEVIVGSYRYGYGNHYQQTALETMLEAGWLPDRYGKPSACSKNSVFLYERENDYPIIWTVSNGLKRECVANGKL